MDLSSFFQQFREETAENVRALSDALIAIESATDDQTRRQELDRAFRAVHTVKGSARMLGLDPIAHLAHTMEHALGEIRQGQRPLDRALADTLLRGGDLIAQLAIHIPQPPAALLAQLPELLQALGAPASSMAASPPSAAASPAPTPSPAPASPVSAPVAAISSERATRQTVRVRIDRLDRLFNLAGELTVNHQLLAELAAELDKLQQAATRQQRALLALEQELARLRFSPTQRQTLATRLEALRHAQMELVDLAQQQRDQLDRHLARQHMLVKDVEQEVMAVRLLPIAPLFNSLPRLVRDLAATTGKQVTLELRGETTELDRKVLELISDPLVHLVRNAIDHGIELPAERIAAGKPPQGVLRISAEAVGNEVRLRISDDGRGIDPDRIRNRAVELGMISRERATQLDTATALDLIFQPGFSTASTITEISGRGVGLDVVRSNLLELGGQVQVDSTIGQGTTITLTIPLTLITSRILLAQIGRHILALPATVIRAIFWIGRDQIQTIDGQPTIAYQNHTVGVVALADLLNIDSPSPLTRQTRAPALLINSRQRATALLVDDLLDEREAVIKPLGPLFARRPALSGAVQLSDGGLALLINPLALLQHNERRLIAPTAPTRLVDPAPTRRRGILVVDDSFTTRELLRSILQSAGYDVTVAIDGADALDKLRAGTYDLVVSDIEMPRVDGFTLTTRIRHELALAELPVVLITSLASEEHRRRGLEAGAQAYIVKSQFNQDSLLKVLQQLLGNEE